MEREERLAKIQGVLGVTLALNLTVCALKIVLGLVTGILTIVADGLHSLGDSFSNIIGLLGIRLAQKPPDKKFPYGYEKFETVATLVIASIISITFFEVMKSGVERLFHPQAVSISPLVIVLMVVSVCINIFVVWYEGGAGRKYKSELLIADSSETKTDIFVSIAVIIGVVFISQGVWWLDGVITLFVGLCILRVIIDIIKSTIKVLCDGQVVDPDDIRRVVLSVPGAKFCHAIRSRGRLEAFYLDFHLGVAPETSIEVSHDEICHRVKLALEKEYSGLKAAHIHIEPDNEMGRVRGNSVFAKTDSYEIV
ncbi:MAG TPA: cation diffusion facilitator family transporter [Spirochaetia bacterium]|nr:cation diffusion facilitator family transporter [Spirochaetia bacterium]